MTMRSVSSRAIYGVYAKAMSRARATRAAPRYNHGLTHCKGSLSLVARFTLTMVCALLLSVSAACRANRNPVRKASPANAAPILLFSGNGTSPNDVAALEDILRGERLEYSTIGSAQLNRMRESQMREHRLLIVPGGNFETIGRRISSGATANLRNAIQDRKSVV